MPRPRGGHGGRAGGRGADQGGRGRDQAEAGRQDGEGVARGQALPGPQNLSGGDLQHPDLHPDLRVQDESHKELGSDSDVCTDKDCKLAWLRGRHFSISADLAVASWCCLLARMVTEVRWFKLEPLITSKSLQLTFKVMKLPATQKQYFHALANSLLNKKHIPLNTHTNH